MKRSVLSLSMLAIASSTVLLGCSVEADVDPVETDSAELVVPFTKSTVTMRGDLYLPAAGDSVSDLQAAQKGTPYFGWRLVRASGDSGDFTLVANRMEDPNGPAISVDPEMWLLDESFVAIQHVDNANAQTKYASIRSSWGNHSTLYLVARNKTPAKLSFQQQASTFQVSFKAKGTAVPAGTYNLLRDKGSELPATDRPVKPAVYLERLEIAPDGSWKGLMHSNGRPDIGPIAGPWYELVGGRLTLVGFDLSGKAGFEVAPDSGVLHVRYRYTGSDHLTKSGLYDLVDEHFSSPLPYGRHKATGAYYVPDPTLSTGYRMTGPGASLDLSFSAKAADGKVTVTVTGLSNQGQPYVFPMAGDANDSMGEYIYVDGQWNRTPWALSLHRSATGYDVLLERYAPGGASVQMKFDGALAP